MTDMLNAMRWLPVPDGTDDDEVMAFAMSYDGYALHAALDANQLLDAVGRYFDPVGGTFTGAGLSMSTEEVRATLFAVGRASRDYTAITEQPATAPLLRALRSTNQPLYPVIRRPQERFGIDLAAWDMRQWTLLREFLPETVLSTALQLPKMLLSDELAWLALTSKPELAVRDRLGWMLQQHSAGSVDLGLIGTMRRL